MKNFEITEKNKYIFKHFLDIKTGKYINEKADGVPIIILLLGAFVLGTITLITGEVLVMYNIPEVFNIIIKIIGVIGYCAGSMIISSKLMVSISIKEFQKKYPEFDINIDLNELKKELEKYEQLSKAVEKRYVEIIAKDKNNNLENMSYEEKIRVLEKEKEFWQQEIKNQELIRDNEKIIEKKMV